MSMLTVHKFYNDFYLSNTYVSESMGLQLKELNGSEEDFLDILNFDIVVTEADLQECHEGLNCFF